MRISFLFSFTAACVGSLAAQPVLQNTVFPEIGDVITIVTADSNAVTQGGAGANQTWDFSVLEPAGELQTTTYVAPNETPSDLTVTFPDANISGKTTVASETYFTYYRVTPDQVSLLGSGTAGVIPLIYTNPEILLKAPMSFNGSFSDDYASNQAFPDASTYTTATKTVTYDAYGTLKMPGNITLPNAMRFKTLTIRKDTAFLFAGYSVTDLTQTLYSWFVNDRPGPLVTILYSEGTTTVHFPGIPPITTDFPLSQTINYASAISTGTEDAPEEPDSWTLTLAGPSPAADLLRINLYARQIDRRFEISLMDAQGKVLQTREIMAGASDNLLNIPVSQLPPGTYFIQGSDGSVRRTLRWVKG